MQKAIDERIANTTGRVIERIDRVEARVDRVRNRVQGLRSLIVRVNDALDARLQEIMDKLIEISGRIEALP